MMISVILCTRNPRPEYLGRVLDALRRQSLDANNWELLIVDNASEMPLSDFWPLDWHPNARHTRELELGLTAARLRGISESRGDILIFVDDDNLLDLDYLEVALAIHSGFPQIGVSGGQIFSEFEVAPPTWAAPYLPLLALREFDCDVWSNQPSKVAMYPCGAGIGVRRAVAVEYSKRLEQDPRRRQLGRSGTNLASGEDDDIVFTAEAMGRGVGVFKALRLTHLIPGKRLTQEYLIRLQTGIVASGYLGRFLRGDPIRPPVRNIRYWLRFMKRCLTLRGTERKFHAAAIRGENQARRTITELGTR